MTGERTLEQASAHIRLTFRALLSRDILATAPNGEPAHRHFFKYWNTGICEIRIFWLFLFFLYKYLPRLNGERALKGAFRPAENSENFTGFHLV